MSAFGSHHDTDRLSHSPDECEGGHVGGFADVDKACSRWLEKRGLKMTREQTAGMQRHQVRDFNVRANLP